MGRAEAAVGEGGAIGFGLEQFSASQRGNEAIVVLEVHAHEALQLLTVDGTADRAEPEGVGGTTTRLRPGRS